ncbi:glucose-methanol-choline oxidoreductase [Colletotrichum sublineola]|uniref:Putative glucose-methanol-choline oxidoreductase n=1 Tax=Colletotrichum sublineola TaxID=1173701 RepID=A0A066XA42_COLSU|nr:glucose-methanol-choline oxidoreductase [Colletotrichum sublineola]KDN62606.1 putative glucose-methanol-choline oxidoreductase [Colletotrichum sublineola]
MAERNGEVYGNGQTMTNGHNGANGEANRQRNQASRNTMDGGATMKPVEGYDGMFDPVTGTYPRISRPVELIRPSYDVVVIGSGYGGAVAASRMARGNKKVCLLERGKERWPGEFPSDILGAMPELHSTNATTDGIMGRLGKYGTQGDPTGLYHLYVGDGQNAFVGNGLGGTSLLNANVFLEADDGVLDLPIWPEELKGPENFKKYYKKAADVLEPEKYPEDFPKLHKLETLEKQAKLMGWGDKFDRVPQTTRFEDGMNSTGVYMRASTLSGQDTTGLNDGSKSTTLVNYLSDAWNWGAEMFCQCEVRYVTKAPEDRGGYIVHFAWHGSKRANFDKIFHEDLMWVHAKDFVFFGAGSLGTTEILLRSKTFGLEMSNDVGQGMSGNGDILAFGYNTNEYINSMGRPDPPPNRPVGPCITGVIDCRHGLENPLDGFVIEEGAVPQALAPFYQRMLTLLPGRVFPQNIGIKGLISHVAAATGSRVFGPYYSRGSTEKTQCYLIMSHDSSQATMQLKNDRPMINYSGVGKSQRAKKLAGYLAKLTNLIGGIYVDSPFYAAFGEKEITVHAIGGARISADGTGASGGVNHKGQLFRGETDEVHEKLVVCDGTIIPAALGVNPFATITALAERSVEMVAKDRGINILEDKNRPLNLFAEPAHNPFEGDDDNKQVARVREIIKAARDDKTPGIAFTEMMDGWIHFGEDSGPLGFERATETAKSRGEYARFFLSCRSWNTHNLVNDKEHEANLTGTFTCPALGGTCMVQGGKFQLFNDDPRSPDTTNLTYNFLISQKDGKKLHFNGYKVVNSNVVFNPWNLWKATTTLYCTITEVDKDDQPTDKVRGKGVIHIRPSAFLSEVTTMEPTGSTLYAKAASTANFLGYFTAKAANAFLTPFIPQMWPSLPFNSYKYPTPWSKEYTIEAVDRVKTKMYMWNPIEDEKEQEGSAPIVFLIPGAAVDHQIFALPTIENNAVTYFRKNGYRVYSMVHRVGKTVVAQQNWTTYDARRDIHAALKEIRRINSIIDKMDGSGPSQMTYVVAHCAGSVALASGLLDGTIPRQWLSGVTASQVFMNPKFAKVNKIKASLPISMANIYNLVQGKWFDCTSTPDDGYLQQAINQVLRFYPVGHRNEICNSVVCHRSSLVFGRLWSHQRLNEATHSQLENFVGGTSMASLSHLMYQGTHGFVTDSQNENLVTPQNIARLKGLDIFLFSGTENDVYEPENTDISFTTLSEANGGVCYERQVFKDYGHLDAWMSPTAHKDVFPRVLHHMKKVDNTKVNKKGEKMENPHQALKKVACQC